MAQSCPLPSGLAEAIRGARAGKKLPGTLYVHRSALRTLPASLQRLIECVRPAGVDTELVKLSYQGKVSFLSYPGFEREVHPALTRSVVVDATTGHVRVFDYSRRPRPPILHRKELVLPR